MGMLVYIDFIDVNPRENADGLSLDPERTSRRRSEGQVRNLSSRNHGFYYTYDRAPNATERLESIYR